ncbi:MAG: GDYXXLXY domain-containing protein [Candidatus Eremiobacterota bacterium]
MNWPELLDRLADEGLVEPDSLPDLEERSGPPWYVRLLLGLGAWIASIFAVVFLFMLDVLDSEASLIAVGLVVGVLAVLLRRSVRESRNDFFAQLGLAGCVTSQILVTIGLGEWLEDPISWGIPVLGFQAGLLVLFPDRTGRFLTCLGMSGVVSVMVGEFEGFGDTALLLLSAVAGWLWWRAPSLQAGRLAEVHTPAAFGAVCGVFMLLLFGQWEWYPATFVSTVGLTAGVAWLSWRLGEKPWPCIAVLVLGASTYDAPGVMAAVGALLLGFLRHSGLLQGLAWLFLILFGVYYYYWMEISLLLKSELLAVSGLVLLGTRWLLLRGPEEPTEGRVLQPWLAGGSLLWVGLAVALGVPNLLIAQKEALLRNGSPVLLELAPVDPRSLMQGDYMRLQYAIAGSVPATPGHGKMVISVGADQVARFVRLYDGRLAEGERLLAYHRTEVETRLGAETYFFQEGQAEHFARARYGELRVEPSGESVLVGLRDADRNKL